MSILLFLIILIVLVMIHEAGHFVAAKLCGMRVEEFAFGFPPKIFSKKIGETEYKFNLLPIGGYVKITGESFDPEEREKNKNDKKSFQNKSALAKLFVLSAGIIMNLVLAASLFFVTNLNERYINAGDTNYSKYITNPKVIVTAVMPNSPTEAAGISINDTILEFKTNENKAELNSAVNVIDFVKKNNEKDITVVFQKSNGNISTSTVRAVYGVTQDKKSIGMGVAYAQKVSLSPVDAFKKSAIDTYEYTKLTVLGMLDIFKKLLTGGNVMESLSGPVGIAKMVGGASAAGWEVLAMFVAILSINLAVFNALPIPALDGGRILFVIYEFITRKKINLNFQYYSNLTGFLFLIGLMITVTYFDLFK